jgi:hypothetical protein
MSNKIVSIRCKVCGEYETTKLYASTNREANRKAEWMSSAGVYTCSRCKAASQPKPCVSIRIDRWDGATYRVLAAGSTYDIKDSLRKLDMRWGQHAPTPTSDADGDEFTIRPDALDAVL